ncbi:hypothetical protein JG687_00016484, partial [Phytophthora cactorum]
ALSIIDNSIRQILPALNNATTVPSATVRGKAIRCPRGSLFQTSFNGVNLVLCASSASGFTVYGHDIMIKAEYVPRPSRHNLSPLNHEGEPCPVVATPTSMGPTAIALLSGTPLPSTSPRNLKAVASDAIEVDSCDCMSTPRPCVFLHGLGNLKEEVDLQDNPKWTKKKFGYIGDHAPCCTTVKYAVLNTVDAGWTNETLQRKFCEFSLSMSETSDLTSRTISDTIVVTHSMGGLVLAAALATGKWVMDFVGKCPVSTAKKSLCYQNGKYSTPELNAAYTAAQEAYRGNVTAALCSKSYNGVLSMMSPSFLLEGTMIPHRSKENDGLVEFQSCLGGLDPTLFGDSYLDRFYAAKLNHADTAFLTHDSLFKDSQKPFKWFECLL